ncbi:MAG: heme biosynthesis HemY N-terminal domain-containing protein [Legionella sp.]
MMRIVVIFLLLLASVYLGIQLKDDPGYVLIGLNNWTMETTLWFALFSLAVLFLSLYTLICVCHKILATPKAINRWNKRRLTNKAQAKTRKGLIEYSEGYWDRAQNHLIQALPNTDTPLLNYLTAARAAQKMGDSTLRDHYLREAQHSMPEAKIAVELTQAQLQLANKQWEQALATLRHLHDLTPRHPYVLKLLMTLYQQVRDWPQLITLLPELKKQRLLTDWEFAQLQQQTYLNALDDSIKLRQPDAVNQLFKSLPRVLAHNPDITARYAQFLLQHQEYRAAEHLLRSNLRKEYSPQLIELYGFLPGNEQQLEFAESLLKKNAHCAVLLLTLGRLSLTLHLWGKAKLYFEQSIELNPESETYYELGALHEQLNEPFLACAIYKKGLALNNKKSRETEILAMDDFNG